METQDLGVMPNAAGAMKSVLEWKHDIPTRYFATYEALEDAFRNRVAGLVPRYHAGTRVFWDDFQRLTNRPTTLAGDGGEAYITSNPRDCLAFGTPFQVLQGAWLSASRQDAASLEKPDRVAERFGLSGHLHQSIRSLSGGETVRLALAKAYLQAPRVTRLTVASPFSWLSLDHWRDFRGLADHYRSCGTPLELFALEGEDSSAPTAGDHQLPAAPLSFSWRLQGLQLDLGSLLDHLHDRPVWAGVASVDETLSSPCLLCGDNGQGKSLIAKALASAMRYKGEATVYGPGGPRRVRLLFQDVLNQTLMRSMRQLTLLGNSKQVAEAYDDILEGVRNGIPVDRDMLIPFADRRRDNTPLNLLEMKILLVAVRLVDQKAVLILDEPDWGLTRLEAEAFVTAVVCAAHARSVPVMLISHKPWWQNLVHSVRWVRKETVKASAAEGCLFRVRLHDAPGGDV